MSYSFSFEKLNVWQDARVLVKQIYDIIVSFPQEEKYALSDQLKRAAISVASNIAEGTSRSSYKEKVRFIEISYGSLLEVYSQLILSIDLGYVTRDSLNDVIDLVFRISNELTALRKHYMSYAK